MAKLRFVLMGPRARLPTQSMDDVGFDLYAHDPEKIPPHTTGLVGTGLALAQDPGTFYIKSALPYEGGASTAYCRSLIKIEGRSGMALKGVWPVGGIIDPGYRGEIGVVLFNSTPTTYHIEPGDRIAQLVWYPVVAHHRMFDVDIELAEEVVETERGDRGFGSTGD